jgi:hypothetical protein
VAGLDQIIDAYRITLQDKIPRSSYGEISYPDHMPATPNLPAVVAYPTRSAYSIAMGPGQDDTYDIAVAVLCATGADGTGQRELLELVDGTGARSIRRTLFFESKRRVEGQLAALGVPHLRVNVTGFDSWGIRFAQVSVDHIGAIVRTQAITWAEQAPT